MATVQELILRASTTLRDQEPGYAFTTWSKAQLISYLNEGLCELAGLRPDLFVETRKIPLQTGAVQTLPDDVVAILDVNGNVLVQPDGTEVVTENIKTADQDLLRRFGKKRCFAAQEDACPSAGTYEANSFVQSKFSQNEFRVEPPVPAGVSAEVTATVQVAPKTITVGDYEGAVEVPCSHHAQLLDWVLHRAYEQEIESEYAMRAKTYHLDKFYHGVGQDYFGASRMKSGYVLGMEGHGDGRSGVPRELRSMRFGRG